MGEVAATANGTTANTIDSHADGGAAGHQRDSGDRVGEWRDGRPHEDGRGMRINHHDMTAGDDDDQRAAYIGARGATPAAPVADGDSAAAASNHDAPA